MEDLYLINVGSLVPPTVPARLDWITVSLRAGWLETSEARGDVMESERCERWNRKRGEGRHG
jgi:hypothetical protein